MKKTEKVKKDYSKAKRLVNVPFPKVDKASKGQAKRLSGATKVSGSNKIRDLPQVQGGANDTVSYESNPALIWKYAKEDLVIRRAINVKMMEVLSEGYSIEPTEDNSQAEEELKEWEEFEKRAGGTFGEKGEQISFLDVLRNTCLTIEEGDDLYWEVLKAVSGHPGEINVLDWEDMRVVPEGKHGKIKGYKQIVGGKKVGEWDAEQIVHKSFYRKGTRFYGHSLVQTVMFVAAGRKFGQMYAGNIFLNQKPKGMWIADLGDVPYKIFKDQIKENKLNPNKDLVFQGKEDKIKHVIIATPQEMQYKDFIQDNREEILLGMGTPPPIAGLAGTGGWDADIMYATLDKDTNMKRRFIESIVNDILFPMFEFKFLKFTINRSNKRDEVKEVDIALKMAQTGCFKRNEVRDQLGFREVSEEDGGEDIIGSVKQSPFGSSGIGSQSKEPHEDETEQEGVTTGEKELNLETGKSLVKNAKFKNPNYWKRSFGSTEKVNKSIFKQKELKIKNKRLSKMEKLAKAYEKDLFGLLGEYIDQVRETVKVSEVKGFFFKKSKETRLLEKISDPKSTKEQIDALRDEFITRGKGVGSTHARKSYEYGIDAAELETGIVFSKMNLRPETLNFLETMNIDIVEGAFTDLAKDMKTQIRIGMLQGESVPQIAKRLDTIKGNVEKVYKNRFKTIARTEAVRASNMGSIEAYKSSGIAKVQVLVGMDPDGKCAVEWGASAGTLSKPMNPDEFHQVHVNCTCVPIPVIE